MKYLFKIFMFTIACGTLLCINGCGDNNDSLSGWYVNSGADNGGGGAYNFTGSNSVEVYTALFPMVYDAPDWMKNNTVNVKGKKYYYNYMSNYTYTMDGDVIIIPMAGQILNKSGKTLRLDGSNQTFDKR